MRTLFRLPSSLALAAALILPGAAQAAKSYQHSLVGNPADVVLAARSAPALALMGGGSDVDAAFRWMIQKGGGGNFVVLRSRGADDYNPYVYALGGASSVETIVIPSREAANDPFVIARIEGAEAVFIAGGDQSDYIKLWQGSAVQGAIDAAARRNVPVGGTSAGLAVLSKYLFTALNGGVTSAEALKNPFDKSVTLGRDFLNLPDMGGLILDSHLDSRDRMGRLVTFMARIVNDGWAGSVRGIGVDVDTALLVDNGSGTKVGAGSVYFLHTVGLPDVCKPKTPLTYRNLMTQRLSGSGSFDVRNWASYNGGTANYAISALNGVLSSTQPGGAVY